ncbi:MAG: MerR family transcriptional regulator [Leptospiraceae bacterium]|nr:MerR family transcriptional regulator [Leptospiraceae bacterium]
MLISELSRRTGVSRHTIRYYEKFGLISPRGRRENNYREYEDEDRVAILFIDRVKRLGFSLKEIREFMELFHGANPVGEGPDLIRQELENKRVEFDRRLKELNRARNALDALIASCDARPDRKKSSLADLLEALDEEKIDKTLRPARADRGRTISVA